MKQKKQNTHKGSRSLRILRASFNKTSRNTERKLQNFFVGMGRWACQNKFQVLISAAVVFVLLLIFVEVDISEVLFSETNKSRGELLKFVGAAVAVGLVVWGLFINNRKIQEQTRQNEIAELAQINTRFKDAALLLNSGETSAVLSGIYALHFIAQEATRSRKNLEYVSVIHDILCAVLRQRNALELYEKGKKLAPTVVTQAVLEVLFGDKKSIYRHLRSNLSGCVFNNLNCSNLYFENVDFVNSLFEDISLINYQVKNATVVNAELVRAEFALGIMNNVQFLRAKLVDVKFGQAILERVSFYEADLRRVDFGSSTLLGVGFENTVLAGVSEPEIVRKGRSLELTRETTLF